MDLNERARLLIAAPELWPHRPRLPVVRLNRRPGFDGADFGYLVEGLGFTVFIGNVLMPAAISGEAQRYGSLDALLTEWRID